ncbi:hypothetical protein COU89_03130 [Candidatus Roizmanbacteria bacterium CG10_big_fil_rev_8_21_14_0_10_45_7]|uniref:Single-stranded-DNA-specific exonuclease RecJ n=1 Tax=Candidatus Roizmanbacteria bacterium CG10_big_fil_rev_8_21_14_0_10_45_7 TaxID=1974854 RepID=A0A2M8KU70_9BACT|nr:MAG: hypothetical protein COU89_03130 [Candidatus Roizmanbacteria bacterium CG10_big_fil_rev_8_21_14_0_10_45_7]
MKFDSITTITGIHDSDSIIARILIARGIPKEQHNSFLNPQHPEMDGAYNSGIGQNELKKVIRRIKVAKQHKESVVIYADYDVDGITSAAILWRTLKAYGLTVMPFIPQRSQGYGFSDIGLDSVLAKYGPSLIIAVDHGINESAHITRLKSKGVDVMVLDHHEQNDGERLVDACAVIHTTLLSAAGISYMVATAFSNESLSTDNLVLAGIASLADVIPQRGLARALSYHALRLLSRVNLPGIAALMAQAGLKQDKKAYTSYDIGYLIAPRINAAGRLGDPLVALRLLCTTNPTKAREYAQSLELLNRKRQDLLKETLPIAYELVKEQTGKRFRCIASPLFNEGIIGLLAGRLMHELQVPVFVGSERNNGMIKGSARSIDGVNMMPLMQQSGSLLLSFGGHEKAGGFSLSKDNMDAFIASLDTALTAMDGHVFEPVQHTDLTLPLPNITTALALALESLEPYGEQNQKPLFMSHDVLIVDRQPVGRGGTHMRVVLKDIREGTIVKGIYFSASQEFITMSINKPTSIVYQVECNRWKGTKAQVMIQSVY